jgi:hypothetical protein
MQNERDSILYYQIDNWERDSTKHRNKNGVKTANFTTSKNLIAKSTMFPHPDINTHRLLLNGRHISIQVVDGTEVLSTHNFPTV